MTDILKNAFFFKAQTWQKRLKTRSCRGSCCVDLEHILKCPQLHQEGNKRNIKVREAVHQNCAKANNISLLALWKHWRGAPPSIFTPLCATLSHQRILYLYLMLFPQKLMLTLHLSHYFCRACECVFVCVQCKYCVFSRSGVWLGAHEGTFPLKAATHFGEVRLSCRWGSSQLQELRENKRPSSSRPDDLYIRYERER